MIFLAPTLLTQLMWSMLLKSASVYLIALQDFPHFNLALIEEKVVYFVYSPVIHKHLSFVLRIVVDNIILILIKW